MKAHHVAILVQRRKKSTANSGQAAKKHWKKPLLNKKGLAVDNNKPLSYLQLKQLFGINFDLYS